MPHSRKIMLIGLAAAFGAGWLLVRGKDEFDNFDDELRPQTDYGQPEQAFHKEAVSRFQLSIAEQAGKY